LFGGKDEGWGAIFIARGKGETTAVPNGAKLSGVSGSGVSVMLGLDVRIGAIVVVWGGCLVGVRRFCVFVLVNC
jgi:hypothetical protein